MKRILFFLLFSPFIFSCHKTSLLNVKNIDLPTNGREIIKGGNNYGFKIFKEIDSKETDRNKNIMYSPLSLNSILYMIINGAKDTTLDEIKTALDVQSFDASNINETYNTLLTNFPTVDKKVTVNIANSIWANNGYTIQSKFSTTVSDKYQAEIQNLDFSNPASVKIINDWVKDKTKGKISKIIDNLNMNLLVLNTIYFYGQWHTKFNKTLTIDRDFYLPDSTKILVPTMEMEDTIRFATGEKYIIVELPYSQGNYVMDLILPQYENTTDSILNLLDNFDSMVNDFTTAEITILLPKFEFSYENKTLADILSQKMPTAFSNLADFSNMVSPNMYIDKVIQKTYIKTDESGTKAVASSGFSFMATSALPAHIYFNRPFIFVIREISTNTVMFVGKIANPSNN